MVGISRIAVRELLQVRGAGSGGVIGKRVEVDCRFHVLVSSDFGGVLLLKGFHGSRGCADDGSDLLSTVGGVGSTQVQVDEVLVDEGEAAVKVQQILMQRTRSHHRKEFGVWSFSKRIYRSVSVSSLTLLVVSTVKNPLI